MDVDDVPPAWVAAIGTGTAYLLVLGILFVALFVIPYLIFAFL